MKVSAQLALQPVYGSNLPLAFTRRNDTRARRLRTRVGEPRNVIVSSVYIQDNGQRQAPRDVPVAYDQNLGSRMKMAASESGVVGVAGSPMPAVFEASQMLGRPL